MDRERVHPSPGNKKAPHMTKTNKNILPKYHSIYAGGLPYLASQTTVALDPAGTVMFWPGNTWEPLNRILGDCGGTRTAKGAGGLDKASWNVRTKFFMILSQKFGYYLDY